MWNTRRRKHAGGSSTSSKASRAFRRHRHKLARLDTRLLWQFLKRLQVGRSKLVLCAIVLQLISSVRISRLSFSEPVLEKVKLLAADQWCGGRPDLNHAFRHQWTECSLNWGSGIFIYQMRWQLLRLERISVTNGWAEAQSVNEEQTTECKRETKSRTKTRKPDNQHSLLSRTTRDIYSAFPFELKRNLMTINTVL